MYLALRGDFVQLYKNKECEHYVNAFFFNRKTLNTNMFILNPSLTGKQLVHNALI